MTFGRALPAIRAAVDADMKGRSLGRRQVLATAVRLIDIHKIRPGNEKYARNGTRGASTLKPGNLRTQSDKAMGVRYTGKSGKTIELSIEDRALRRTLARLKRANRGRLFRYRDRAGGKRNATSAEINAYLRSRQRRRSVGEGFSHVCGLFPRAGLAVQGRERRARPSPVPSRRR